MRRHLLLLPLLALATGCAASTYALNPQVAAQVGVEATEPPSFTERVGRDPEGVSAVLQRGHCSWYGPRFHGRRTSSGEVFDKNALTAAHPSLPFGSQVEVTDVASGRSVRVRINDRGPFSHGRILDLSYAAAASLGIVGKGTADVQLRLVDVDEAEWSDQTFALEVGSFRAKADADRFVAALTPRQRAAGLHYVKSPAGDQKDWKVRFGPFPCEEAARSTAGNLQRLGLKPSITPENLAGGETTVR